MGKALWLIGGVLAGLAVAAGIVILFFSALTTVLLNAL